MRDSDSTLEDFVEFTFIEKLRVAGLAALEFDGDLLETMRERERDEGV
jgi:hypothetical protein